MNRPRRLRYGPRRAQRADLWLPAGGGPCPVVMLLHGGFWRWPYTKVLMRCLAADSVRRGWAAWNVEYRRLGRLGGAGGYPATFDDVAGALDHLAALAPDLVGRLDLSRVVVCGHSAGGTLALWLASHPAGRVDLRGAVSLAGICDLRDAAERGLGEHAVRALLAGSTPPPFAECSPAERAVPSVPLLLVHGRADDVVPVGSSEGFADVVRRAGGTVELALVDDSHRDVVRPRGDGWAVAVRWITTICGQPDTSRS